jgi:hypothetical protein
MPAPPPPKQMQSDVNRHKIVIKSERYTDMQCIKMHISDRGVGGSFGITSSGLRPESIECFIADQAF